MATVNTNTLAAQDVVSLSWCKSLLDLLKSRSLNVTEACIQISRVLRADARRIPRSARVELKRQIRKLRTDSEGRNVPWSRVDRNRFVKTVSKLAMRLRQCRKPGSREENVDMQKGVRKEGFERTVANLETAAGGPWWRSVLRFRKAYPTNAAQAYVGILKVLREHDRHISRSERAQLKGLIREMRTDRQGRNVPWSRVDKERFVKAVSDLATRAGRCDDARSDSLQEVECPSHDVTNTAKADTDDPIPPWLGVMRGVELLSTTNAAPIKRVVEVAMDMGAKDALTVVDNERLRNALTSVKKGGTYRFNNGRCLKQTVLSVLSAYVSKYPSRIPYTQLAISQPLRRERKSTADIDKQHEAGEDWHATLHNLCRMVCNNARPMKRLLRIAAHQAESIPDVHAALVHILRNTPCESNSCSLLKREVKAFLDRHDAARCPPIDDPVVNASSTSPRSLSTASAAQGATLREGNTAAPALTDERSEEVFLAAISGDGKHEYAMKCDKADLQRIFRYAFSLDRSPQASAKLRDAFGPHSFATDLSLAEASK
ncbi:hypothetical protein CYMTET_20777 [Cymbomonas tetramitiformis]|uniref:Uncharacterized protein n=1 Tax=Cymbomonas tetramitiformis TaxID=36881 RepID=A0AAE0G3D1_9CHLO|nr:hypothetical protein CYMTET_20777 [Cymbomonas tetramitiformis]